MAAARSGMAIVVCMQAYQPARDAPGAVRPRAG